MRRPEGLAESCVVGRIAGAAILCLVLAACATGHEPPPIGAAPTVPDSYPVNLERTSLSVVAEPDTQSRDGLTVSLKLLSNQPKLFYRYDVSSKRNGTYVLYMPNPPKLYSVYRVPFFRNDPDASAVEVSMTNTSSRVIDTSHAVCAFDVDGETLVSQPLKSGYVLPGHVKTVSVNGPALSQLKGHTEMTVWIYQLAQSQDADPVPFKWTLDYALSVEAVSGQAELVTEAPYEAAVVQYENLVEPAASNETSR